MKRTSPTGAQLPPHVPESALQASIVTYLEVHKFRVLVTNAGVRNAAQQAGRRIGTLNTPGVPDLLVTKDSWPTAVFLGLEVKRPASIGHRPGALTPAQKELLAAGRIIIVRSMDEALDTAREFEQVFLGLDPGGPQ